MFEISELIKKRNAGFVLTELIIATTLGLLLLSALIEVYLSTQRSIQLQVALYQNQQRAKEVIDFLSSEISKAGYVGCAYLTDDFPVTPYLSYSLSANNKLSGHGDASITVRYMEFPGADVLVPMRNSSTLFINAAIRFMKGDILVISDCNQAEIFEVGQISMVEGMQKIQPKMPLRHLFNRYAEVGRLQVNNFYVAKTNRRYPDGSLIYTLTIQDINRHTFEIIEGMSALQIRYSSNQDGHMIDQAAEHVRIWGNVQGVSLDFQIKYLSGNKEWHMYVPLKKVVT
jgi:type IV pilus assembly protein PilW